MRLAEGVTRSRIMGRNRLVEIRRLSITPSANRNSYRVARLVGAYTQGSVLRPQPWAGESQLRQSCCCLRGGNYVSSPLFFASVRGDKINTKSRVVDGGFALAWTVAPIVGKRVFLRVASTIPTVMHRMTPSAATVKKAAYGRSKSPAFAGTKTAANWRPVLKPPKAPPHALPKGREFLLAVFEVVVWRSFPLGKVRMGLAGAPSPWGRQGWGF